MTSFFERAFCAGNHKVMFRTDFSAPSAYVDDKFYYSPTYHDFAEILMQKDDADPGFIMECFRGIYEAGDELQRLAENIRKTDYSGRDLPKLIDEFRVFAGKYEYFALALVGFYLQIPITKRLKAIVKDRKDPDADLAMLTFPRKLNFPNLEMESFLEIVSKVRKAGIKEQQNLNPEIRADIRAHIDTHGWVNSRFGIGYPWTEKDIFQRIMDYKGDPDENLAKLEQERKSNQQRSDQILRELDAGDRTKSLVEMAKELVFFRTYRTDILNMTLAFVRPLLEAIAERKGITHWELLHYAVEEILDNEDIASDELERRMENYLSYTLEPHKAYITTDPDFIREFREKYIEVEAARSDMLKGTSAFKGRVIGKAKLVFTKADIHKVRDGDMIVAPMTTPDMVPAMERASAFVTDEGGITCHAAIIAREMKKPCIIGTKFATQSFKDKDLIEVDADNGIVRKFDPFTLLRHADEYVNYGQWVGPVIEWSFWMRWSVTEDAKDFPFDPEGDIFPAVDCYGLLPKGGPAEQIEDSVYLELKQGRSDYADRIIAVAEKVCAEADSLTRTGPVGMEYIRRAFELHYRLRFPWQCCFSIGDAAERVIREYCESKGISFDEFAQGLPELPNTVSADQERLVRFKDAVAALDLENVDFASIRAASAELADELDTYQKETEYIGTHHFWGIPRTMDRFLEAVMSAKKKETEHQDIPGDIAEAVRCAALAGKWRMDCAFPAARLAYRIRPFLTEIAQKHGLTYDDIIWARPEEILEDDIDKVRLEERKNGYGIISHTGLPDFIIVTGDDLNRMRKHFNIGEEDYSGVREFRGQTGNKGKVKGRVIVMFDSTKTDQVDGSTILVAPETTPDYVPAMTRAAAFITDRGGITSHAAIMAREMGKPCIIGTKIATKALKDGDEVEVDADNGTVTIISKAGIADDYTFMWEMKPILPCFYSTPLGQKERKDLPFPCKGSFQYFNGKTLTNWMKSSEIEETKAKDSTVFLDEDYFKSFLKKYEEERSAWWAWLRGVEDHDFTGASKAELLENFRMFMRYQRDAISYFGSSRPEITYAVEQELINLLKKHIKDWNDAFAILATPTVLDDVQKEQLDFAKLVKEGVTDELLLAHAKKYAWLVYGKFDDGGAVGFLTELASKQDWDYDSMKNESDAALEQTKARQEQIYAGLGGDGSRIRYLAGFLQFMSVQRMDVKSFWLGCYFLLRGFWKRLADVLELDVWDFMLYIFPPEIEQLLEGTYDKDIHNIIEARKRSYAIDYDGTGDIKTYEGEAADRLRAEKIVEKDYGDIIQGQAASLGKYQGKARLVMPGDIEMLSEDIRDFQQGEVLITTMTQPNMMVIAKRAGAIVADEGGITSHAAIISRELKIPCIVGCLHAMKAINTGDLIEVDANAGTVRIIRRAGIRSGTGGAELMLWGHRPYGDWLNQVWMEYMVEHGTTVLYSVPVGDDRFDYLVDKDSFLAASKRIGEAFIADAGHLLGDYSRRKEAILAKSRELSERAGKVPDADLVKIFRDFWSAWHEWGPYLIFPHYCEQILESQLKERFKDKFSIISAPTRANEYLLFQKALLGRSAEEVIERFAYQGMVYMVDLPYTEKDIGSLKAAVDREELERTFSDLEHNRKVFEDFISDLSDEDAKLCRVMNEFVFIRTDRMDTGKHALCLQLPFMRYVLGKISPGISMREGSMMSREDILKTLEGGLPVEADLVKRGKRESVVTVYDTSGIHYTSKDDIRDVLDRYYGSKADSGSMAGVPASKGKVQGRARLYLKRGDIKDDESGYIMVTKHTSPQDLPVMKRAIAIVADEGGVTSHAAIVSRELGIPGIVGTKNAAHLIKDNDLIEVDANAGTVRIIKRADELPEQNASVSKEEEEHLPIDPDAKVFRWGPAPCRPFYMSDFISVCFRYLKKAFPEATWPDGLLLFKDRRILWMHDLDEFYSYGKDVFRKLMLPGETREKIHRLWIDNLRKLQLVKAEIDRTDLKKLNDGAFLELYRKLYQALINFWLPTIPPEISGYGSDELLRERLLDFIPDRIELSEAMEVLTAPEELSFYQEEELALLKADDIEKHQKQYYWIRNSYAGTQVLPVSYFEERKASLPEDLEENLKALILKSKSRKEEIRRRHNLPSDIMHMADVIRRNIEWQDFRKGHIFRNLHYTNMMLEEAARRKGYDSDELRNCLFDEIPVVINGEDMHSILKDRDRIFGLLLKKDTEILPADTALHYWDVYAEEIVDPDTKEFSGQVACKGPQPKTRGRVRILLDPLKSDFDEHDILVAPMTTPEYVFAMKKASAVITNVGGLTQHAAIVSRELNKPCIVGTRIATQVLKDGMHVEVDTEKGTVKILEDTLTWFVVEHADVSHFLYATSPLISMTKDIESLGFPRLKHAIAEFSGDGGDYIFVKDESVGNARKSLDIIKDDPSKIEKTHADLLKCSDDLFAFSRELLDKDLKSLSNSELADYFAEYEPVKNSSHMRRGPMWIIESSGEVFSKYLISYLGDIIKKQGLELNPDVVFATLSTPKDKTVAGEEKVDFLKIAAALAEDADDEKIRAAVKEHADKYRWIPYGISGPAWDNSHFVKEMKVLLKKGKAAVQSELNTIKSEPEHIQKQKDDILRVLDIDEQHMRLIRIAEGTIYGKAYSKDALFFGFFAAERLYLEMAERLGIDLRMIRHMMPSEIIDCLKGAPLDRDDIKERCRRSVIYVEEGRPKVYSGKAAEDFLASLDIEEEEEIDPEVTELKGSCARQGYGTGKVKIINTAADVPKMQEGDVLVSHMTDPEIVVAMKKASAIVTDMGGIICHAAIVSRELGIPCIIGTKHATKVLKDGQLVEVDADSGTVRILEGDDAGQ